MKFATQNMMEPAIPIDASRILVLSEDDRHAFEITLSRDGHSIEVRGCDTYEHDGVVYLTGLQIIPHLSNSITITSMEWKR
jgi:hypothetical protein